MSESANKGYQATLNLPKTAFPMKADLVKKEPEILKKWAEMDLYGSLLKKNAGRPRYILHDGPPYANGRIHFGHILNKILKDIIVKFKNMSGFQSPYVPGWDCHGLPIEHEVDKELGPKKKTMSQVEIRKRCREYAQKFASIQKEEFKRLGILGEWDHPYMTMSKPYEAAIAREFANFAEAGHIYKRKKPVLWCSHCQTALAEAEVEYEEEESPSIYVRFPLLETDRLRNYLPPLKDEQKVSLVIWTTTPWTLPANVAVALNPNHDYVALRHQKEIFIVAKNLADSFTSVLGLKEMEQIHRFSAQPLAEWYCAHPFLGGIKSRVVLSNHVTVDTGTGCVHIAPGHGQEDYEIGLQNNLPTVTPVDENGNFTQEAGVVPNQWIGKNVLATNPLVIEELKRTDTLVAEGKIRHSYPHCWRCKRAVIFRATEQWFVSMSEKGLRTKALDAIRKVQWIPPWGRERIYGMVEKRPDWCLSRQRSWGVPIIAFRCNQCQRYLLDPALIRSVADRFEKESSDYWFEKSESDLLPSNTRCGKCGGFSFSKETDILDVWFDSGVSFAAVLEKNPGLQYPADLYLEGSDQHRGWFHASLLASVGTRGMAPYKGVLTHGFVVDSRGKKYSKSAGNYIPPDKVLNENGAEILRLWVAAEDYRTDIRVSTEIITRLIEAYRKIRNTCRFMLGNLCDYDPDQMGGSRGESGDRFWKWLESEDGNHISPRSERASGSAGASEIDLWALHHLQKLILRIRKGYEELNFHIIFHELNRFCTVDLSAFYLDILKDRLYTSAPDDPARRSAQQVLFEMVTTLARLMAPILSFTAEEVWQHLPAFRNKAPSVFLTDLPVPSDNQIDEVLAARWESVREVRDEVLKVLEKARQEKVIGNSLEAKLVLVADGDARDLLESFWETLPELFQVSQVQWGTDIGEKALSSERFQKLFIEVRPADGRKCERCWNWRESVGLFANHPTLCERCRNLLEVKK